MAAAFGRGIGVVVIAVLAGVGCTAPNPRALSRSDVAAGCAETTPLPCEAACFRGSAAACAIFGAAVEGAADPPVRLPQDMPRGRKALDKGCKLGNLAACRVLVSYDTDASEPGADCAGWEGLCKRGDARSCTFFAECLDWAKDFRRDKTEALRLFRENCDRGEHVACRDLGFRFSKGDGVPKDLAKAVALLDRACRMDDPYACAQLGWRLEIGQGAPRDLERAKALYRMSCARGIRPIPCEGLRHLGETPPPTLVSSADATESNFVSARNDYEWRVPANWEFVPPSSVDLGDVPADAEVVAARLRGGAVRDSLMFAVGECTADASATSEDGNRLALDGLERDATSWLAGHGITRTGGARNEFWGHDAVRVEARLASPDNRFLTLALFCWRKRRFEVRCLSERSQPGLPCRDALGALAFHERRRDPVESPRVLHLRDRKFRVSFDAPDDSWLGVGPHISPSGLSVSWLWFERDRNIDVTVFAPWDGSREAVDRVARSIANVSRKAGATVTTDESALGGEPCAHVASDPPGDRPKDVFVTGRGGFVYLLAVSAPKRDADLLARARAGLRFGEPGP